MRWKSDASVFDDSRNSLSIDCERSGIFVIDVDLPGLDEWNSITAGIKVETFTVRWTLKHAWGRSRPSGGGASAAVSAGAQRAPAHQAKLRRLAAAAANTSGASLRNC